MRFAPIFKPEARRPSPKPIQVDLRKVFVIGTALWSLALVVAVILWLTGIETLGPALVCAAGVVIGLLLLGWERFNRSEYRRLGE
ncbi:DUF2530 domain-containing protein [Bifidobacterium crudilactis]|jgi:hypothetical protein|uniref:DUF2530 domain-containing protein n=1 Tax=Bifidobacterium crudilactis TaxID=327277 RepID=A0A971CZ03_9BIFI|nr:DUF2530 domain-containing protein [Bifidobacterium crudilactis]MCI1218072.1 DUF2530 domain-containing protein [Bifidobacterium crudilactis]MCI1664159.1 DUF2530 domain-containing protein [Bifidobacterium crudilactis]MCI1868319.1 DUF2530 domain-containing protein [Bifidobacterium crudilactis]MCI2149458.1 DUF2530 domain-containing protein [Bifidobacterium crudilactis]MCI2158645.1 DUF2530 domain-containing protein [Bifidobacterium crudilactis]